MRRAEMHTYKDSFRASSPNESLSLISGTSGSLATMDCVAGSGGVALGGVTCEAFAMFACFLGAMRTEIAMLDDRQTRASRFSSSYRQ